jgi:hypothetical protein
MIWDVIWSRGLMILEIKAWQGYIYMYDGFENKNKTKTKPAGSQKTMKNTILFLIYFFVCSTVLAQDMSHVDIVKYQDGRYGILPADAGCYEGSSEIIRGLGLSDELRALLPQIDRNVIVEAIQSGTSKYVVHDNSDHTMLKLFYETSLDKHLTLKYSSEIKHMDANIENVYVPQFVFGMTQLFICVVYVLIFVYFWSEIVDEQNPIITISIMGGVILILALWATFITTDSSRISNPYSLFWLFLIVHLGLALREFIVRRKKKKVNMLAT